MFSLSQGVVFYFGDGGGTNGCLDVNRELVVGPQSTSSAPIDAYPSQSLVASTPHNNGCSISFAFLLSFRLLSILI